MKKSEIKIFKKKYEAYKTDLLYYQEELKKCEDLSYQAEIIAEIIADISSCRHRIDLLKDLAFKFDIESELGL